MLYFQSTEEAAREHGVSGRRMRTLLQQGRVKGALKFGKQWMIPKPFEVLPPAPTSPPVGVIAIPGSDDDQ